MKRFFLGLLPAFLFACSPSIGIKKTLVKIEKELQDNTGFFLFDPGRQKTLVDYHGAHYFTPASNTKIFTLFSSLQLLGDSITSLKYVERNDSTIFWGMGDPSFLYSKTFQNDRVYHFLKNRPGTLCFSSSNFHNSLLGPGWAWDDYYYNYSAERSPFPVYGNLITVKKRNLQWVTSPSFFMEHLTEASGPHLGEEIVRDLDTNQLTHYNGSKPLKGSVEIPFHYSTDLVVDLLSDTLKRIVEEVNFLLPREAIALKSLPADSLYRVMMQDSDNFIAEQLLMQCAATIGDTLSTEVAIRHIIKTYLNDLPDAPRWVDGSGLSRFNLFTPRSIVKLWEKIYQQVPRTRLFKLLAVGGKSGTIKNWYKADPPYIFGKTGTLSNNHCLSGFLITKKGRLLIFAFMNNNFTLPGNEVRKRMNILLRTVHEKY